jgi:hypothetical protein
MRIMKTSVYSILFLVLLCSAVAAAPHTTAMHKGKCVERTFHISGELTFIDVYSGFPMTISDIGVVSHLGRFFDVGKYDSTGTGLGIFFMDDGDQIFWKDDGGGFIEITGGTGRFQDASGNITFTMSAGEYVPGPNGSWSYVAAYKGEFAINYHVDHP